MNGDSILVVRLGAMGDIIHTLPAAASLKQSFPDRRLIWVLARKWTALLEGNPYVDEIVPFERGGLGALAKSWRTLRAIAPRVAVDFQGLMQSALVGRAARPKSFVGLDKSLAREPLAALLYMKRVKSNARHRVERYLDLAAAAGAACRCEEAWIPPGHPEGDLPDGPFVLANPFAGWAGKQWPIERYRELADLLARHGFSLVVNVPPARAAELQAQTSLKVHVSGIPGLIDATRRAHAVIGVDSGPLHLAAALGKPGVAIYGPTDPAQTGPFKSRMTLVRVCGVDTSYQRDAEIHSSMRGISADQVAAGLLRSIQAVMAVHPA